MADTTFTIDANVNPAVNNLRKLENAGTRSLKKLQKDVQGVTDRFAGFGRALGSAAVVAFFAKIGMAADKMKDLSDATGLTVAQIDGLGRSLRESGNSVDNVDKIVLKFARTLEELGSDTSGKLVSEFEKIGISVEQLKTLSDQDLFRETIRGLAELQEKQGKFAAQAAGFQLIGKSALGTDFEKLNATYDQNVIKGQRVQETNQKIADIMDNLALIFQGFVDEVTRVAGPFLNFFLNMTGGAENLGKAIGALTGVVIAFGGAWLIFAKILPAITTGMNGLQTVMMGQNKTITGLSRNWTQFLGNLERVRTGQGKLTTAAGASATGFTKLMQRVFSLSGAFAALLRIAARFAGIAGIIYGVYEAMNWLVKLITGSSIPEILAGWGRAIDDVIKKFFGFSVIDWVAQKVDYLKNKLKPLLDMMGFGGEETKAPATTPPPGTPAPSAGRSVGGGAMRDVLDATLKQKQAIKEVTDSYKEQQAELQKNLQSQLRYLDMSQQAIDTEQAQAEIAKNAADAVKQLQQQREELIATNGKLNKSQMEVVGRIDTEIAKIRQGVSAQQQAAADTIAAIEARRLAQEKLNKELELTNIKSQNSETLLQLQEQLGLVGMYGDELENNLLKLDVERELRGKLNDLAIKQIEIENQRKTLGEARFQQEMAQLEALRQAAMGYANARLTAEQKIQEATRKSEREDVGGAIKKRLAEIERSVDPAVLAVQKVDSVFSNMNSALDDFVKTGKFKFKDFARSVIQDLIAIELKATATKLLSNIIGSFGSILGFANGGNPPINKPSIVGERGPELFVPKQAGTIIPNGQFGMGGGGGGPVTNNYITNNINALDAKSVAQLFAENRKTLFGAVEMAKKETPYRTA